MTSVNALSVNNDGTEPVARTVNAALTAAVGVPVMTPLDEMLSSVGRVPRAKSEYVTAPVATMLVV